MVFVLLGTVAYGQTGSDAARKLDLLKAYPDQIVVNGKIYTMDGRMSQVQAMAVRSNRILALGTNDEMRFLAGPKTEVIDAKGRAVLPALVDPHIHPNLGAVGHWLGAKGPDIAKQYNLPEFASVPVRGTDSATILRGLEQAARQRASELGPGKWIVVWVLGGKTLEESNKNLGPIRPSITEKFLDNIAPNNPMIVFIGAGWLNPFEKNTKAKEEWIRIMGADQKETLMTKPTFLWNILLRGRDGVAVEIMKRELLECVASHGVGTFGDRYDRGPDSAKVYRLLYEKGEMPVRYGYYVGPGANGIGKYSEMGYDAKTITDFFVRIFQKEIPDWRGIGNDYIWYAGTASEGWNGPVTCTKAEPPPRVPEGVNLAPDCAKVDQEKENTYQIVRSTLESGKRVSFLHSSGSDGVNDALLNMLDKAVAEGKVTVDQVREMRITTEHTSVIRPDQVARFAKYNMIPGMTMGNYIYGGGNGPSIIRTYGERYMNWLFPLKSLVAAGGKFTFDTDVHLNGEINIEWKSMGHPDEWSDMWDYLEFFATRTLLTNGITYNKAEALDKVTVLKGSTIWPAEGLLKEKHIGSLEVGKLADFIVIDKDYFAIPDDQIHTIKTLLTVVGGKTVFKAQNY